MSNMISCYRVSEIYPGEDTSKVFLWLKDAQEYFRTCGQKASALGYVDIFFTKTKLHMKHVDLNSFVTIALEEVVLDPYTIALYFLDEGEEPEYSWPQDVHTCYSIACDDYVDEANYAEGEF